MNNNCQFCGIRLDLSDGSTCRHREGSAICNHCACDSQRNGTVHKNDIAAVIRHLEDEIANKKTEQNVSDGNEYYALDAVIISLIAVNNALRCNLLHHGNNPTYRKLN